MWGKNVDDTYYHYFTEMPDAEYLCGRHKQAKYCFTSEPSSGLCSECQRRLNFGAKPIASAQPHKGKPRELTEATVNLLFRLEGFMSGCWNDNIQNYGPGGMYEGEGRGFGYPISFIKVNGEKLYFRGWQRSKIPETKLTHQEILGGYYQFGSHRLPVFENLYHIILYIEREAPLCYELTDMSAAEMEQDVQRQKLVESRWWHLPVEGMSRERKHLLIQLAHLMCRYYSGFALKDCIDSLPGYPVRVLKRPGSKLSVRPVRPSVYPVHFSKDGRPLPDLIDPQQLEDEVLLSGCCHFGANEFHVYSNLSMVLRYLEVRYGLAF